MRDPEQAAHALGKLIVASGENIVLWRTDSIWYSAPQDQIQATRTCQLSAALATQQGYRAMTPETRAAILGLNAANVYGLTPTEVKRYTARDAVARKRMAYLEKPDPHFRTYGPKTRREFLRVFDPAG